VAVVADVAVAALPDMSIPQVPEAPDPVVDGTLRFVRASAAVEAPVPPSATARSVIPDMVPPVIATELADCVAIDPKPRLVLASAAVEAPVPPSAMAISVTPVIDPPVIETLDDA